MGGLRINWNVVKSMNAERLAKTRGFVLSVFRVDALGDRPWGWSVITDDKCTVSADCGGFEKTAEFARRRAEAEALTRAL